MTLAWLVVNVAAPFIGWWLGGHIDLPDRAATAVDRVFDTIVDPIIDGAVIAWYLVRDLLTGRPPWD